MFLSVRSMFDLKISNTNSMEEAIDAVITTIESNEDPTTNSKEFHQISLKLSLLREYLEISSSNTQHE